MSEDMSDEEYSTLVDGMSDEEVRVEKEKLKDEARQRGYSEDDIKKMMAKGAKWNEAYKEKEIEDQNKDFKFKGTVDGVYDPNSTRKGLINEYKSRSGLISGTESYEVVNVDFSDKNTAMEFTCNCGAKVSEADLSQHMKDMHGSKLGEARYKTYKTEHNLLITENDSNAKDTAVEGLYEQYIDRYGESESWRLGGGFGEALRNDDLKDAWQRADLGNRDRLVELSGLTKEDLEVLAYGNESMKMDGYEMEDFYSSEEEEEPKHSSYKLKANPDGEFTTYDEDNKVVEDDDQKYLDSLVDDWAMKDLEKDEEVDEDDVKVSLNVNDGTLSDVPIEESYAKEEWVMYVNGNYETTDTKSELNAIKKEFLEEDPDADIEIVKESKAREVGTEICTCGHFGGSTSVEKNQHEDHFQIGHGACKECECQQFTWTPYNGESKSKEAEGEFFRGMEDPKEILAYHKTGEWKSLSESELFDYVMGLEAVRQYNIDEISDSMYNKLMNAAGDVDEFGEADESNDDINSPDTTGFSQDRIGSGNYWTKTKYEDEPNKDIGSNSLTSKKGSSHSNGISETDRYYANMIGKLDD